MKKKTFVSPQVLQTVETCLEENLLAGASAMGAVQTLGAEKVNYNSTDTWYD